MPGLNLGLGLGLSTPVKGAPLQIYLDGVLYERVQDDETGEFVFDDDTSEPRSSANTVVGRRNTSV